MRFTTRQSIAREGWEPTLLGSMVQHLYWTTARRVELMSGSVSAWCEDFRQATASSHSKSLNVWPLTLSPASIPIIHPLTLVTLTTFYSLIILTHSDPRVSHSLIPFSRRVLFLPALNGWHLLILKIFDQVLLPLRRLPCPLNKVTLPT
jgi:hypothetical protein